MNNDILEIVPLADIHLGDPETQMNVITTEIEKIKSKPNRYCILAGDLMNTAIKTSISDTYSETLTPQQQLDKCIELFEPIRNKILCIITGNHEERISKLAAATFKSCTYATNSSNMTLSKIEQTFVNTASSLAYGGYGDRQGYVPASNAYPVICLDSKEKKVSVCL